MSDQADSLRQLVRQTVKAHPALEPGVPMWVLSGGKSGVGTSTVALQLALELAGLGKRAVLIDASPSQPDLTSRLCTKQTGSLRDVLSGERSVVEVLTPISERVRLLPGCWDADSPPELHRRAIKRLIGEIRRLHAHADVVLLDAGHGMSPWVQWLWKAAQQILLVTTTEPTTITESYATIKLAPWGDVDNKLRLVVNRVQNVAAAEQLSNDFAATCRQFLGIKVRPHATIARETTSASAPASPMVGSFDRAFTQTIRLLAADLMRSALVMESPVVHRESKRSAISPLDKKQIQKTI